MLADRHPVRTAVDLAMFAALGFMAVAALPLAHLFVLREMTRPREH